MYNFIAFLVDCPDTIGMSNDTKVKPRSNGVNH